jgi:hypothetical protein
MILPMPMRSAIALNFGTCSPWTGDMDRLPPDAQRLDILDQAQVLAMNIGDQAQSGARGDGGDGSVGRCAQHLRHMAIVAMDAKEEPEQAGDQDRNDPGALDKLVTRKMIVTTAVKAAPTPFSTILKTQCRSKWRILPIVVIVSPGVNSPWPSSAPPCASV